MPRDSIVRKRPVSSFSYDPASGSPSVPTQLASSPTPPNGSKPSPPGSLVTPDRMLAFEPFRCDALLSWAQGHEFGGLVIFIVVVSVLALLITINAIQGTLWHPESWSVVVRDLNVLFLARSEPTSGTYFPLQRDLATFFVIMLEGTNVLIIIRQWRAIGSLLPKMQKEGVLTFVSVEGESAEETRGKLDKGIAKINRRFETASKSWLWLMAAFVALALVLAENNLGIFTHVTASPSRSWTLQAYQGWWANLDTHGFAFGVYFMFAVLVMRYVIAQNYVGIEVLGFFFRHRTRVKYTFDDLDGDRHFGWNSVRQVMWTIYISVLLNATALGLQIIIVPTPIVSRFPESLWSFVLLAMLFALGPVFVFLPC